MVLILIISSLTKGTDKKPEKVEWNHLILSENLPDPGLTKGNISTDSDNYLSISMSKADVDDFNAYIESCKDMGYVEESYRSDLSYSAYRKDGYQLSLRYTENKKTLQITLNAPQQMDYLTMPKSGLGSIIPVPESVKGTIIKDSADKFSVRVGETSKEAYRDYVAACEDAGFGVDYDKKDTTFSAYNEGGAYVKVNYISFQLMDVTVEAPKQPQVSEGESKQETENEQNTAATDKTEEINSKEDETVQEEDSKTSDNEMRPGFKEAMDSYEEFYVQYCDLMKKYSQNPTDIALIGKYTKMMQQAVEMSEDFEKWDQEELNTAELKYYLEVNGRVTAMLLEANTTQ